MRYIFVLLFVLASPNLSHAQMFELGPYLGGSNFVGDVGATTYIRPNKPVIGIIGKWNQSPRYSWRATVVYTQLKADDAKSNQDRRRVRGYYFSSNMFEASFGIEFDFWEWDIYARQQGITPYISTGIAGYLTDRINWNYPYKEIQPNESRRLNKTGLALPIILGFKANISPSFNLAMEIGARMAFENDLDGSETGKYKIVSDTNQKFKFGNSNNFDWYVFTGLTFTYSFGRRSCYDVY